MKPMLHQQSEPMKRMAFTPRPNLQIPSKTLPTPKSETVSEANDAGITNRPLYLEPFNQFAFPNEAVEFLNTKQHEINLEFENCLQTVSQLFTLKLEHLRSENATNVDEQVTELVRTMNKRIELKRREVTNKWKEVVGDQEEILQLKQQLMDKQLVQFKQQVHFESQPEFLEIMKSQKISSSEKEEFKMSLKSYRDQMIDGYKKFRDGHYHFYNQKLSELQA